MRLAGDTDICRARRDKCLGRRPGPGSPPMIGACPALATPSRRPRSRSWSSSSTTTASCGEASAPTWRSSTTSRWSARRRTGRRRMDAVSALRRRGRAPHVVLMDLAMEPMDGVVATERLRAAMPEVEVVAVTSLIDQSRVEAALQAGATGYLVKDAAPEELAVAIRAARRGEMHLDGGVARRMMASLRAPPRASADDPFDELSERELRDPAADRRRRCQQGDRPAAGDQRAHRAHARQPHPAASWASARGRRRRCWQCGRAWGAARLVGPRSAGSRTVAPSPAGRAVDRGCAPASPARGRISSSPRWPS